MVISKFAVDNFDMCLHGKKKIEFMIYKRFLVPQNIIHLAASLIC